MNWGRSISSLELFLILFFLVIYGYYFFRMNKIGQKLGMPSKAIYFKFLVRIIYFGLMIVASLGPNFGISKMEERSVGKDIIIAVDLSSSMDCMDVSPSRLEKTKLELTNFIEQATGDRMAVLIFSSKAYWQIPLTFDLDLVKEFISQLNTSMLNNNGSNLEAPLLMLANKKVISSAENRPQIGLLFTDGESFNEISSNTKRLIRDTHLDLKIIGVGTEDGADVLQDNIPLTDENGDFVISKVDIDGLTKLSEEVGANLTFLNNTEMELQKIDITPGFSVETSRDNEMLFVANNKYQNFLIFALILAVIDLLVTTKVFQI